MFKKIAIIISKPDPASLNIKEQLEKLKWDAQIYEFDSESIHNEDLDKKIDADLFIFATKHESKNKIHSLTTHSPGNWSDAVFGGKDRELCVAPASILKIAINELNELGDKERFEITTECTHHGPYMEKPIIFIEIGSSPEQFTDEQAGKTIARAIVNIVKKANNKKKCRVAFAIGGLHHCHNFQKFLVDSDIAIGHVCPKYQLENLDEEMFRQALERTYEKVDQVIVDWKGLGPHKEKIKALCDKVCAEYGIEWKKIKNL